MFRTKNELSTFLFTDLTFFIGMQAETLLKTAHSFYINDERYRKVRKFNKDSREFDFKEVLQELNIPLQG